MTGNDLRSFFAATKAEAAALPLPDNWVPWKEPRDPTPVDLFITGLIAKRRPPRIDPGRAHPFACPYHFVRSELHRLRWDVDQAVRRMRNLHRKRGQARSRYQRAAEQLQAALDAIKAASAELDLHDVATGYPTGDQDTVLGGFGDPDELSANVVMATDALRDGLRHAHLLTHALSTKPADFHRRAFLAGFGRTYAVLTNRLPKAGDGPFPPFAAVAYTFLWEDAEPSDMRRLTKSIDFAPLKIILGD